MNKQTRKIFGKAQMHIGNVHSDMCQIVATDKDITVATAQMLLEQSRVAHCQLQLLADTIAGHKLPPVG